MSLNSTSFIQTLINSGADASLNLFEFTFQPQKGDDLTTVKETFSCRVTQITNLYQRDNTTTEIGYQNISIPVIGTGTQITRTLGFNVRIDEDYYVYDKLRQLQSIDNFGNITFNKNKRVNVTIKPLRPATNGTYYYGTYKWKFYDCYIYSVSALTFAYSSATTGDTSVNFIWSYYEEEQIDEEGDYISALATAQRDNEKGKALTQYYRKQQAQATAQRDNEKGKAQTEYYRKQQARINAQRDNEKGKALTEYIKKQAQVAQSRAEEQAEAELHNSAFDSYTAKLQAQANAQRDNEKGKAQTKYYERLARVTEQKQNEAKLPEALKEGRRQTALLQQYSKYGAPTKYATVSTENTWATANESDYEATRAEKIKSITEPTKSSGSNLAESTVITTLGGLFNGKPYEAGEAERAKESIKSKAITTIKDVSSSTKEWMAESDAKRTTHDNNNVIIDDVYKSWGNLTFKYEKEIDDAQKAFTPKTLTKKKKIDFSLGKDSTTETSTTGKEAINLGIKTLGQL